MATLDALIVTLGLDPAGFQQGAAIADEAGKKLQASAIAAAEAAHDAAQKSAQAARDSAAAQQEYARATGDAARDAAKQKLDTARADAAAAALSASQKKQAAQTEAALLTKHVNDARAASEAVEKAAKAEADAAKKAAAEKSAAQKKADAERDKSAKQSEKQQKDAADQIRSLKNEVLGLFAVFEAGKGIAGFLNSTNKTEVATAALSAATDVGVEKLTTYQAAYERMGATAEDVSSSFKGLAQVQADWKLKGIQVAAESLQRAAQAANSGGDIRNVDLNGDREKALENILHNAREIKKTLGGAAAIKYAQGYGISEGQIAASIQLTDAERARYLEQSKNVALTEKDTEAGKARTAAAAELAQTFNRLAETLLTNVSPALISVEGDLEDLLNSKEAVDFSKFLGSDEFKADVKEFEGDAVAIAGAVKEIATEINDAVKGTVGWKFVIEALIGLKVAGFFLGVLSPLRSMIGLIFKGAKAWGAMRAATVAARTAAIAASEAGAATAGTAAATAGAGGAVAAGGTAAAETGAAATGAGAAAAALPVALVAGGVVAGGVSIAETVDQIKNGGSYDYDAARKKGDLEREQFKNNGGYLGMIRRSIGLDAPLPEVQAKSEWMTPEERAVDKAQDHDSGDSMIDDINDRLDAQAKAYHDAVSSGKIKEGEILRTGQAVTEHSPPSPEADVPHVPVPQPMPDARPVDQTAAPGPSPEAIDTHSASQHAADITDSSQSSVPPITVPAQPQSITSILLQQLAQLVIIASAASRGAGPGGMGNGSWSPDAMSSNDPRPRRREKGHDNADAHPLPAPDMDLNGPSLGKSANKQDKTAQLMQYFQSQGWSKEQAAGVVSNLTTESGLRTDAVGDNGHAVGLAQWHGDRSAEFKKLYGKEVKDASLLEQAAFVNYELTKGTEKAAGNRLRQAKTAGEAGAIVSSKYERPLDRAGNEVARAQLAEKIAANASAAPISPAYAAAAQPGAAIQVAQAGASTVNNDRSIQSQTTVGTVNINTTTADPAGHAGAFNRDIGQYGFVNDANTSVV